MFCTHCGHELSDSDTYCGACGAPVGHAGESMLVGVDAAPFVSGAPAPRQSYEYARATVGRDLVQATVDCYESLGYELTGHRMSAAGGQAALSFRRGRAVRGKAQLAKVQRGMDDTIGAIERLEASKTKRAATQAISLGIVAALVLGIGMCCTMVWTSLMIPGIVIGVAGIAGCVLNYLRYRSVCAKDAARIEPQVEEAYDRLATLCEEAQTLRAAAAA